eukprot:3614641-Alexandrium_andersonii.AAC.1
MARVLEQITRDVSQDMCKNLARVSVMPRRKVRDCRDGVEKLTEAVLKRAGVAQSRASTFY